MRSPRLAALITVTSTLGKVNNLRGRRLLDRLLRLSGRCDVVVVVVVLAVDVARASIQERRI
jgi:hypothetical protein